MHKKYRISLLMSMLLAMVPITGLWAAGDSWQSRAAEAISLVNQAGIEPWYNNLTMLWTEPDSIRRWMGPKPRQDKLEEALALFKTIPDQAVDNQVALAWARSEAYLGRLVSLNILARENNEGRVDLRFNELDLALYLREWNEAGLLADQLESEGVQSGLTYRRAILAGLKGQRMLADSLWREAVSEGLPITQAVYKELCKSGLNTLVNQPNLSSKLRNYLDTLRFIDERNTLTPALVSEGYQKGIIAYEAGRYEEAIRDWRKISGSPEMRLSMEYMIGEALNRLKRYEESEPLWRGTIKANPDFFLGYLGLAEALRGKGQSQKADDWLKSGFRRTNSVFLLKNTAITPSILKEAQGSVYQGSIPGYQYVELGEQEIKDADSLWISWNYGRDWLLYPYFINRILLPAGKEYWLKGTGDVRGLNYPDLAIRVSTMTRPTLVTPITISHTNFGELPTVSGEWDSPVEFRFEYWRPGEPRFVVKDAAQPAHRLTLENAAPGGTYHYRAYVTKDGYEIALAEGEFSTESLPFWVSMRRPTGLAEFHENRITIPVSVESMDTLNNTEMRWAEEGQAWSAWSTVHPMTRIALSPRSGMRTLQFQFKDEIGRVTPVLHERVMADAEPPRFLKLHWRKSNGENWIEWQTDELSISRLWIREKGQWRQGPEETGYHLDHRLELPEETERVQIWAEDLTGNLAVGSDETNIGIAPISLRINDGDIYTSKRLVQLNLGWRKKPADTRVRFSNNGKLWGPWKPIDETFPWRLETGEGEKSVFAQIHQNESSYVIQAKIILDQTPPSLVDPGFIPNTNGETSIQWQSSEMTRTRFYWETAGEALHYIEEDGYKTDHRLNLGRLKDAPYIWRLEIQDEAGNLTVLTDGWFQGQREDLKLPRIEWGSIGEKIGRQRVWLQFNASDNIPVKMRLRNRGEAWRSWQPFEKSIRWTLKSGFEYQWVEAQFKDDRGNISPISCRLFQYDIRPARLYSLSVKDGATGPVLSWRSDKKVRGWVLIQRQNSGKYDDYDQDSFPEFSMEGTLSLNRYTPGIYRIRLFVEDLSGDWSWSPWIEHRVSISDPS